VFGKRKARKEAAKRNQKVWRCSQCNRVIRFNLDMLCDPCKIERDLS